MSGGADRESEPIALSVVIPAFNSADWLPSTIAALQEAMLRAEAVFEIIIVDDGSTDRTGDVVRTIMDQTHGIDIRLISQPNRGRFMARFAGAQVATHPLLLVLDSRMLMRRDALRYLTERIRESGGTLEWNCHVETDPEAPLVGRFWEVPVMLFWHSYLARPRPMSITVDNFDRVPKGTGGLVVRTSLFLEACRASWPQGDARLVSDDTKILRYLVASAPLTLDPGYSAIYRPRTTVRAFLSHAHDRGSLFVDSYAGTTWHRSVILIALALTPFIAVPVLVVGALVAPPLALALLGIALLCLLVPAVIAGVLRVGWKPLVSYVIYVIPFGVYFWAGLLRGISVHRHLFIPAGKAS